MKRFFKKIRRTVMFIICAMLVFELVSNNKLSAQAEEALADAPTKIDVTYFVLNRGLEQPPEVQQYGPEPYSAGIPGTVIFGTPIKTGSGKIISQYSQKYKKGITEADEDIYKYLLDMPSREAIKAVTDLQDDEDVRWYVIKTSSGKIHVDGIIEKKAVVEPVEPEECTITVCCVCIDKDGNKVELLDESGQPYTQVIKVEKGNDYLATAPTIPGYKTEITSIAGVAEEDSILYIEYTLVTIPEEQNNPGGNTPGGNTPGGNTPGGNTPEGNTPQGNAPTENGNTIIEEAATTGAAATTNQGNNTQVATNVINNQVEEPEEVEIQEEPVPLAPAIIEEEVVDTTSIMDEEVPLAHGVRCWVHWLVLGLMLLYTAYEFICGINKYNKINKLKEDMESVEV